MSLPNLRRREPRLTVHADFERRCADWGGASVSAELEFVGISGSTLRCAAPPAGVSNSPSNYSPTLA
jgi:hypothetical protein